MYPSGEGVDSGEDMHMLGEGIHRESLSLTEFSYEPKTSLKKLRKGRNIFAILGCECVWGRVMKTLLLCDQSCCESKTAIKI